MTISSSVVVEMVEPPLAIVEMVEPPLVVVEVEEPPLVVVMVEVAAPSPANSRHI